MALEATKFQQLLANFKLEQLFIDELGWDRPSLKPQDLILDDERFQLTTLAQKRGVAAFLCGPDSKGQIPQRPLQLRIDKQARQLAHEHLTVFYDTSKSTLKWLWVNREPGQPARPRTHTWRQEGGSEALRQSLEALATKLEDEDSITMPQVADSLRRAFDKDKVTKRFYERFKQEHERFAGFIKGLDDRADREWYASIMLNRLMFVYFIQRKGFLDGNQDYLAAKLREVQAKHGKGHFHSFYRSFLRRLFHEGLDKPLDQRPDDLGALVGEVPYLNGGLFDFHELEEANPEVDIPDDDAFARLFAFFGEYHWHLDDRPLRNDKEINPDVLGYIFEKYINQKQMGAYYTKEDITEYIGKNTVVPWLLEQARARCKVAFEGEGSVWRLLQESPDDYLYPAMKTGVIDAKGKLVPVSALPAFVQKGMKDAKARMHDRRYNLEPAKFATATGEEGALPTETWREYIARRERCLAIRKQLQAGKVATADALVTLNLNIRQFIQDVIDTSTGPQLLRAIWQAIVGQAPGKPGMRARQGITILDPTCGSGAFLFAALNILEPLYEACLDRMEGFIEDAEKLGRQPEPDFVKVLAEVAKHPSRRYYVYKTIILQNLFGVDIQREAVEICKLRLFLKLVSQAERVEQLEPLPDIDFNIRTGNTLVGFATEQQFDDSGDLASDQAHKAKIKADLAKLADLFDRFRKQQEAQGEGADPKTKQELRRKLAELSAELDAYLAKDYGIKQGDQAAFKAWRQTHQPFHWFAEYFGIIRDGGFDIVIGNPPYVSTRRIETYAVKNYETLSCPDVYAWCLERASVIAARESTMGMIVPLSIAFGSDFAKLRSLLERVYKGSYFSHFSKRPSMLFHGVQVRNVIYVGTRQGAPACHTTRLHRWYAEARPSLFETIKYSVFAPDRWGNSIPKAPTEGLLAAFEELAAKGQDLGLSLSRNNTKHSLSFKKIGYNWISFGPGQPPAYDQDGSPIEQTEFGECFFPDATTRKLALSLLNGKIAFVYWMLIGDDFHLTKSNFSSLPIDLGSLSQQDTKKLVHIAIELERALKKSVSYMVMHGKRLGNYNLLKCRDITDKSDAIYASAFGLESVWDDIELAYSQLVTSVAAGEDS